MGVCWVLRHKVLRLVAVLLFATGPMLRASTTQRLLVWSLLLVLLVVVVVAFRTAFAV